MELGILSNTFAEIGARSVLAAARTAGYSTVQLNLACLGLPSMPDAIDRSQMDEVLQASRLNGVNIAAISGTYNMVHPDPGVRARGLARLSVLIRAAHGMGTRLVTLCTGTRDPLDQWQSHPDNAGTEAWRDLLIEMEKAVVLAEDHDVDLGIEPELGNVVSSPTRARSLIDTLRSNRLKIVLDPANLFAIASTPQSRTLVQQAVDCLADRITLAHAKDRRPDGSFAAAGTGIVDFGDFIRSLRRAGFDGPLVAHGLSAQEAPAVAAFLHDAIAKGKEIAG